MVKSIPPNRTPISRRIIGLVALTYIGLLWVLSSAVSRGQGWAFFVLGLSVLGAGLISFSKGRRSVLYLIYAVTLSLTVCAVGLELLLHLAPRVLKGQIANVSYTGYHWRKGGIYSLDRHMCFVMRPNVHREMYWQGHWWQHDTNADGFRGPALGGAEAVILGDSMIYGHGVENPETVSSQLTRMTGLAVANLGQQGNSMVQCLITMQRKGVRLSPKVVYVSSHFTDLEESMQWYSPEELSRFVASADSDIYLPTALEQYRPKPWWNPHHIWTQQLVIPMRCSGILGAVYRSIRDGTFASKSADWSTGPFLPSEKALNAPFIPETPGASEKDRLQWEAHRHALTAIKSISDEIGAKLVLFDLGYPYSFSRAIEEFAEESGVEYNRAGRVALERALLGESIYLANDGHWSGTGCRIVAEELAKSFPDVSDKLRKHDHLPLR